MAKKQGNYVQHFRYSNKTTSPPSPLIRFAYKMIGNTTRNRAQEDGHSHTLLVEYKLVQDFLRAIWQKTPKRENFDPF